MLSKVKQERLEMLKKRLKNYYAAEEKVLINQEYTIGSKSWKRADLGELRRVISDTEKQIEHLEAGGKNKAIRFVPRDL